MLQTLSKKSLMISSLELLYLALFIYILVLTVFLYYNNRRSKVNLYFTFFLLALDYFIFFSVFTKLRVIPLWSFVLHMPISCYLGFLFLTFTRTLTNPYFKFKKINLIWVGIGLYFLGYVSFLILNDDAFNFLKQTTYFDLSSFK